MTKDILMVQDATEAAPTEETSRSLLQQFCVQAKAVTGAALLDVVRQVLESPGIYVFAELLNMPNVVELKTTDDAKYYNTLHLFAYGTYKQYRQEPTNYLELSVAMQKKLQHLTIVSMAIKTKSIPYDVLLEELEIDNVRHLEDIIIDAIYADIIHGKLFQNHRILEIDYAQGRDIPPGYTSIIAQTLQDWVNSCDTVSNCIEEQIRLANIEKSKRIKNKERIEKEIINLKKTLKAHVADADESMQVDARESSTSHAAAAARKKALKPRNASRTTPVPADLKFTMYS